MTKELYIQNTKYKNTIFILSSYVRHTRLVSHPSGIRDQRKRHKRSVRYASLPWFVHLAEIRRQFRKNYRSWTIFRITGRYYDNHLYVTGRLR